MKEISRSAIVEHSAAEMFALVDDIDSYPRFLPWCQDARVESVGDKKRATLTVGLRGLRQSFTTLNENRPGESIDMRLVEGPFKQFTAAWRFTQLSEQACEIAFSLRYQFASRALGKLLEPLFDEIADTMVDVFTRRADELHPR
ncbi:MAG TPA: type II toxin-antitoxin system RatA family toxin [Burkholderiales bacterium]|nr:type II toxin-antitoxin system RatA family toxin [Burkholderiales bacterium]